MFMNLLFIICYNDNEFRLERNLARKPIVNCFSIDSKRAQVNAGMLDGWMDGWITWHCIHTTPPSSLLLHTRMLSQNVAAEEGRESEWCPHMSNHVGGDKNLPLLSRFLWGAPGYCPVWVGLVLLLRCMPTVEVSHTLYINPINY
jgi:hypothetical protein